jgi:hypothetical protein
MGRVMEEVNQKSLRQKLPGSNDISVIGGQSHLNIKNYLNRSAISGRLKRFG